MNPDETNGLEELPSLGDPEQEAKIDAAYANYDDARKFALLAKLSAAEAKLSAPRRVPIEVETVAVQASSISIEDMATGAKVKVTTKLYAGSPLTGADMDAALEAHGYLHREAEKRAMAGWQETIDLFGEGRK